MKNLSLILFLCLSVVCIGQKDSLQVQTYQVGNDVSYSYSKPKFFDAITNIPKNYRDLGKGIASKQGLKAIGITALLTGAILPADQTLIHHVQNISVAANLSRDHTYQTIYAGVEYPTNISATFYHFGHGNVSLLFATGFLTTGLIKKDYRAIHTSIEVGECILTLGVMTQGLKRVFGRQTPNRASVSGGKWQFFPNLKEYMRNTPNYDAMPSGHMATLISTVTVIGNNYPEVKWIRPVGYAMASVMAFEMMNSGVHWAGDYPLGFLIGYSVATVASNRRITKSNSLKTADNATNFKPQLTVTNLAGAPLLGLKVVF